MDKWKKIFDKNNFIKIDEQVKKQSIQKLKIEIEKVDILAKESYFEKLRRYVPFMSKATFLIQFVLLSIGIFVIKSSTFESTRLILSLVMPILAFLQMFELEKGFKYKMYEIEMSCRMSLKEVISIKLMISTIINLCIMTIFSLLAGHYFKQKSYLLIIYFLVPFMITNVIYIGVIRLLKNKTNQIMSIITMLFVNIILLILNIKFSTVYEISSISIWIILLFMTLFAVTKTLYDFYKKEDIWNLILIN